MKPADDAPIPLKLAELEVSLEKSSGDASESKAVTLGIPRSWEETAGFLSKLLFLYPLPLLKQAQQRTLEESDLSPLSQSNLTQKLFTQFCAAKRSGSHVFWTLWKLHGGEYVLAALLCLVNSVLQFAPPFFLQKIIVYLEKPETDPFAYGYCAGLLVCGIFGSLCMQWAVYHAYRVAMRAKGQLITAVYRKTFRHAELNKDTGKIVNLMSVDIQRLPDTFPILVFGPMMPIVIVIAFIWLSAEMGGESIGIALAVVVPFFALMIFVAKKSGQLTKELQKLKDQRVKFSSDGIAGEWALSVASVV
jgi:hypothetical protein